MTAEQLFGPGTWLVFGIILMPVYVMLSAWFGGDPSDRNKGLMGVAYLLAITVGLWGGLTVVTVGIGIIFFW